MAGELGPPDPDIVTAGLQNYSRGVVYFNSNSRNGAGYFEDVETLHCLGLTDVVAIETSREVEAMAETVDKVGEEGDINLWRGGDGTFITGLSAVKTVGLKAPNFPRARGRKNDLASQLLGPDVANLELSQALFDDCEVRSLHPLIAEYETADGKEGAFDIWSTLGINASAWASEIYNYKFYRHNKLHHIPRFTSIAEYVVAGISLLHPTVKVHDSQTAHTKVLVDRIVANGSQMGGDLKFHASLFEPDARVVDARQWDAGLLAARMMLGKETGRLLRADEVLDFTVRGHRKNATVRVQTGGESRKDRGEIRLRIQRSNTGVPVVAKKTLG